MINLEKSVKVQDNWGRWRIEREDCASGFINQGAR